MKTKLTIDEIKTLLGYLNWNKFSYTEKAQKYFYDKEIPDYRENVFKPEIKSKNDLINKLRIMRDELK